MLVIGIYGDSKFYKLTPVIFSQFTCKWNRPREFRDKMLKLAEVKDEPVGAKME